MKAMVVSPVGGRVPPTRGVLHNGLGLNGGNGGGVGGVGGGGVGGGVGGGGGNRRDMEAEEVAAYLTKLRSLVPDMPRKRKLSKLEVIQRVIEYICDLQTTLEETNAPTEKNATSSSSQVAQLAVHNNCTNMQQQQQQQQRQPFQPLLNATGVPASGCCSIGGITSTSVITTTTITTTTTNEGSSVSYQPR